MSRWICLKHAQNEDVNRKEIKQTLSCKMLSFRVEGLGNCRQLYLVIIHTSGGKHYRNS